MELCEAPSLATEVVLANPHTDQALRFLSATHTHTHKEKSVLPGLTSHSNIPLKSYLLFNQSNKNAHHLSRTSMGLVFKKKHEGIFPHLK